MLLNCQKSKKNWGFTLIELLVVVSIIGILATLVTANLNAARSRARDAERKSDLKNMSTALRMYYNDLGAYPSTSTFTTLITNKSSFSNSTTGSVYMSSVPNDPLYDSSDSTSRHYVYSAASSLDSFTLSTCLENKSDASCQSITVSGLTCSTSCIYQVSP